MQYLEMMLRPVVQQPEIVLLTHLPSVLVVVEDHLLLSVEQIQDSTVSSAIVDFILWFCASLSSKTWSLNLYPSYCFLMLCSKISLQTQLFKTRVLSDIENPKKIRFKPEKGHFLVYFNWATVQDCFVRINFFYYGKD